MQKKKVPMILYLKLLETWIFKEDRHLWKKSKAGELRKTMLTAVQRSLEAKRWDFTENHVNGDLAPCKAILEAS